MDPKSNSQKEPTALFGTMCANNNVVPIPTPSPLHTMPEQLRRGQNSHNPCAQKYLWEQEYR
ncbi:hypothetical protein C5167_042029 [Papaver somniferum]|nr:hypothetical protein C5167_042029 [Papaver somniferum]